MSRAIHGAISSWVFQGLSIVKKTCGDFGMLDIDYLIPPGDVNQIRDQLCCETFMLRLLFSLKLTLNYQSLPFPDNFLFCTGGFTQLVSL